MSRFCFASAEAQRCGLDFGFAPGRNRYHVEIVYKGQTFVIVSGSRSIG
jgi:hypothetical protein